MSFFARKLKVWHAIVVHLVSAILIVSGFDPFSNAAYAGTDGAITTLCSPRASLKDVTDLLKSHIRLPDNNSRYDEIVSGVLIRAAKACAEGNIPEATSDQEARLNTWIRDSRIDAYRRNRLMEFGAELEEFVSPTSNATALDVVDFIHKRASTDQRVVFDLLAQGFTQEEVGKRVGLSTTTVNKAKQAVEALLKEEFPERPVKRDLKANRLRDVSSARAQMLQAPAKPEDPSMVRVKSPIGKQVFDALKGGAEVLPTGGGYAGPVMTVTMPSSKISGEAVDGIVMLPSPMILKSNADGEQEMIVTAVREIGNGSGRSRTFALYAFCKDEHLEAPRDMSRYKLKSVVSDPRVTEIVTNSDLRQAESISQRLWQHYGG
jgi:DNA-directed RNA polymerase specialized sigma24 family protein